MVWFYGYFAKFLPQLQERHKGVRIELGSAGTGITGHGETGAITTVANVPEGENK